MDMSLSDEDTAFRAMMVRELTALLPADIRERQRRISTVAPPLEDQRRWMQALSSKGWSVPGWPVAYGGPGWSALHRYIFEDVAHELDAPEFHWAGTHMIGPVIYTYGSQALKDQFLEPTRTGEILWTQGFSEPGSGSDLASLRTHARLEGDRYIVNGQKIWTSGAFEDDWGFFLVKTDLTVKPQRGVSFLLIDMASKGITVRRIPQLNGEAHLCEVFLDNVEVPVSHLVGEPGMGWTYAKFLLDHERTTSSFIFWSRREMQRAWRIAEAERLNGVALSRVPEFHNRLNKLDAELDGLEWSVLRVLANDKGKYSIGVAASVLKIRGSELQQAITELHLDLIGGRAMRAYPITHDGFTPSAEWQVHVPGRTIIAQMIRASTIYGGTKQIQKNIIAKSAFGL